MAEHPPGDSVWAEPEGLKGLFQTCHFSRAEQRCEEKNLTPRDYHSISALLHL